MKSLQYIPHSNASSDRTISMVRKIVIQNRTSLQDDTVCAHVSWKLNCERCAAGFKPFGLNAAKKATYNNNQAHKKS